MRRSRRSPPLMRRRGSPTPDTPCLLNAPESCSSATSTIITRSFYDGLGRLIETRTPAPSTGNDLVAFAQYDASGRLTWQSLPYSVPAYSGTGSAFAVPDTTQPHNTYTYDGLGRVLHATDPLGHLTAHSYTLGSAIFGVHGGNGDLVTNTVDANGHRTDVWTDPFGRTNIVRRFTGTTLATYALYSQTQAWYTYQGPVGSLVHPDGTTQTTFSYDLAGRLTSASDPDSGTWHYAYDLDGNVTQQTDARAMSPPTPPTTGWTGYCGRAPTPTGHRRWPPTPTTTRPLATPGSGASRQRAMPAGRARA